ncbi:acyl-CoA dehydrogenase family protein [Paenibacillus sacheonensis]|uniref:Acyl-CoA dehydrogenase n=1 Tax=Paenibacillus sacheonensis TaxID=742054 RepID=A0A7X5C0K6_9BACL|nr:acyl-CoA dehydrogenase family protein [Paenibacillus sacheonensis]MBM7568321.1 alkylation response protein AidB-like acyl-CoA dehydrogenase [Paenibacillus sacheonensis]NBC68494.1 acyl-CoA dehydrogenase [Paenibacillus sacheonensis]
MEFGLSEEQSMIRDMAARYAEQEAARRAGPLDESETFDKESFGELAELGFTALPWPEEDGGAGGGFIGFALVLQELSRANASLAAALWAHVYLAAWPLMRYGGEEAIRRYGDPLLTGSMLGGGVLPGAAGSASRLRVGLTAARDGSDYVLEGQQKYVLGGSQADLFVVYAETGGEKRRSGGRKRYSAFIVGKDCLGLDIQPVTKKLGLRAAGMAHLTFKGCRVPEGCRLGREGQGSLLAREAAAGVRCGLAAIAAGIARGAADAALGYARTRTQFGRPIAKHQAIASILADLDTGADAAQLLVRQAAWRADEGLEDEGAAGLALRFAADAAMSGSIQAVQVYGGYGYMKEYPVERYMRDAKAVQMFKGLDGPDLMPPQRRAGKGKERV